MACSSTKTEYHALVDTISEFLWLRWLLKDLGVSTSSATLLYCDNQSAIHIVHNDVFHERIKYIKIVLDISHWANSSSQVPVCSVEPGTPDDVAKIVI